MGIYDRSYYRDEGLRPVAAWDQRSAVAIIIIANVAVHVANYVLTQRTNALRHFLELNPMLLSNPLEWYRVLTYGFTHADGIPHILFNMLSLYFLGRSVEDRYGRSEFFRFYLTALILGGLYWTVRAWGINAPMLGASGAVTATVMLFVFCFPFSQILLFGVIPTPAWMLGILIVLLNVFGGSSGVAYDVHLIGAAFAAIYFYGKLNLGFLGELLERPKLYWKQRQRGLKVLRPEEPDVNSKEEVEADRILAKIHQSGQDSLTAAEKKFMEAYSRRVRQRRAKSQS